MIVSAVTLSERQMTLTRPRQPLAEILGSGAMLMFMVAVFLATITPAIGTLLGAGFIVPQALGQDTTFGDNSFRRTVIVLIAASAATARPLLRFTGFGPVEMAIIMPAINGLIGLPVTVFALIGAVNHYYDVEWEGNLGFLAAGIVLLGG